ncbi:MAG: chaperone modulator CbpM [Dysgonamonadaceae bacterium]|jgi:hypothetical protein|nr:chaperone modulator CbpM [Dysgonamonadaceae bacterium]
MNEQLILISDFINSTGAEFDFIDLLESEGLIETIERENKRYLPSERLGDLEMFTRLHYELEINIEGIDVINNLLGKISAMEEELRLLRNRI